MTRITLDEVAEIIAKYVQKGSPLFVQGRLEFSTWETNDGGKRSKLEVVVENFQFLASGDREQGTQERRRTEEPQSKGADYGDIPF